MTACGDVSDAITLKQSIAEAVRKTIINALAKNDQKINRDADALGISRKKLWEKMKRFNSEK